jgi:hypothetical protein
MSVVEAALKVRQKRLVIDGEGCRSSDTMMPRIDVMRAFTSPAGRLFAAENHSV